MGFIKVTAPVDDTPRAPNELWWSKFDSKANVIMQGTTRIRGWLLLLDSGVWVARSEDGTVRAEFDSIDEAKEFLWAIVNMEKRHEV
jgi:hypothetical protein